MRNLSNHHGLTIWWLHASPLARLTCAADLDSVIVVDLSWKQRMSVFEFCSNVKQLAR